MVYLALAERRREFIDATIRVVSKEGIARATTRRIAEEAGASAASLHYCFKNKDELLQAVFDATASEGLTEAGRMVKPRMGIENGATEVLTSFATWIRAAPDLQVVTMEMNFWALRNKKFAHLPARVYRRYIDGCKQLLQEARRDDEIDVDLEVLARQIIGILDGASLQWISMRDDVFSEVVTASGEAIVAGLAIREKKRTA